ncbi:class III extradiol dioxygenase subunit B-like domain-containing protein [Streptomyces sp. NBC_01221]|uniref:class III extradiol dioxygenase subunit B-like domain-containing protein n=1 Tax=unclassified Streptomyces TaxID=2593676 RepID=UPI00224F383F|nr:MULTISPECIES: class III extradiol dioxygenase subunit B-like domain-containing protein [unclassified Streptomyces]WSP57928.1 class III extradiol dioxygenase subunit B-like domain-containing protein [Streptomyces sp. NBC_01241]WSU21334.1 class III extradiol dioxygenase subunit B-like domain-containing protein [Streptomyces sp. NBC_01108]MCX4789849.1 class III extradiol dioxygenase subunit B-like domain-containing protein [Streptomyces sp. NBC_01221]MCX4794449.1 class III extradiol dioxygenase
MLVAAAVCPCPPLLVPDVAAGAAPELDALRDACADALGVLAAARPDLLLVIGPADLAGRGPHREGATGSFKGFGVDLDVRLGRDRGTVSDRPLPPSLAVGAWLLARARWAEAPVEGLGVGEPLETDRCTSTGQDLAARAERVALLVMGDGSACRTVKAPGYLDDRAEAFDAAAAHALGTADPGALIALDALLAYELKAAGRAPWQVLAGAGEGAGLRGQLLYEDAPYGVGYLVATWS